MATILERDEYIEQAYFYRVFRERLADGYAAQEILERAHDEILSTTRLPLAVQFLGTELKHTGELGPGYRRLAHYFTPFQAFLIQQTEAEKLKFSLPTALLVLEREATYRANAPTRAGLFVYQFETLCRNRLGYDDGLRAMAGDPLYDADWAHYLGWVRQQLGAVEFADLMYLRSEVFVTEQRKHDPDYVPARPPLFAEKEGKIARASQGRDPLYLFAALQRQLNYPEVPRPRAKDDTNSKIAALEVKLRELEARLKLTESEVRGQVDLTQFKPETLKRDDDDDRYTIG
jgi:hypothetical protein